MVLCFCAAAFLCLELTRPPSECSSDGVTGHRAGCQPSSQELLEELNANFWCNAHKICCHINVTPMCHIDCVYLIYRGQNRHQQRRKRVCVRWSVFPRQGQCLRFHWRREFYFRQWSSKTGKRQVPRKSAQRSMNNTEGETDDWVFAALPEQTISKQWVFEQYRFSFTSQ